MTLDRPSFEHVSSLNSKSVYIGNGICLCWVANRFKMYVLGDDVSLSPHLILNGYWESWISVCFLRMLDLIKPSVILNIGANLGYYSLLSASTSPSSHIFAYEPQPKLAALIKKSAIINGYQNLTVRNVAVGEFNGKTWINTYDNYYGSASVVDSIEERLTGYEVDCISLDSEDETQTQFIIIDAEGYEFSILKGCTSKISNSSQCVIFLEFSSGRYKNKSEFIEWISYHYFSIYQIDYSGFLLPIDVTHLQNSQSTLDVVLIKGYPSGFIT